MDPYQVAFLEHLAVFEVIRFGAFTLKSGRSSPYFVNTGQLRTGVAIAGTGRAYAHAITAHGLACDLVFGPAYKGIPLAVATSSALAEQIGTDVGFAFDRKEAKDHGEGGVFVGTTPRDGMRVVVVDDVITTGQSIREAVALVRAAADVEITGVVVAIDRQERGRGPESTRVELERELQVSILPLLGIRELVTHVAGNERLAARLGLDAERRDAIDRHLAAFGGQP